MFNVKVDNFNIQFTFQHNRNVGEVVGISDITQCTLRVNGQEFHGVAACSAKDKFDKEVGRKVSLRRALDAARGKVEIPFNVRFFIWERYFARHISNKNWVVAAFSSNGTGQYDTLATGILDAAYDKPRVGSDDLVNQA